MPYVDVDGQRIRYEATGGNGPAVILCHAVSTDPGPVETAITRLLAGLPG